MTIKFTVFGLSMDEFADVVALRKLSLLSYYPVVVANRGVSSAGILVEQDADMMDPMIISVVENMDGTVVIRND